MDERLSTHPLARAGLLIQMEVPKAKETFTTVAFSGVIYDDALSVALPSMFELRRVCAATVSNGQTNASDHLVGSVPDAHDRLTRCYSRQRPSRPSLLPRLWPW